MAWHAGRSCDEHQREVGEVEADKGLAEYRAAHRMINCPTCGHGIEKISGCNHVTCVPSSHSLAELPFRAISPITWSSPVLAIVAPISMFHSDVPSCTRSIACHRKA